MSALAELLAGGEHLRAEFDGGRADQKVPRWEYLLAMRHRAQALQKRGVVDSLQARTHYQVRSPPVLLF